MFTWDTTQPLPSRLKELLDRAGARLKTKDKSHAADVLIFLPPDIILSSRRLTLDEIINSYQTLLKLTLQKDDSGQHPVLLNGSRLLSLSSSDLKAWQPGLALPMVDNLHQSTPLAAVLTNALLKAAPEVLTLYLELDELSERGGAEADKYYSSRLNCDSAKKLIDDINRNHVINQDTDNKNLNSRQFLEIEKECERQFLQTRDLAIKLKHTHRMVQKYEKLVERIMTMQPEIL